MKNLQSQIENIFISLDSQEFVRYVNQRLSNLSEREKTLLCLDERGTIKLWIQKVLGPQFVREKTSIDIDYLQRLLNDLYRCCYDEIA